MLTHCKNWFNVQKVWVVSTVQLENAPTSKLPVVKPSNGRLLALGIVR